MRHQVQPWLLPGAVTIVVAGGSAIGLIGLVTVRGGTAAAVLASGGAVLLGLLASGFALSLSRASEREVRILLSHSRAQRSEAERLRAALERVNRVRVSDPSQDLMPGQNWIEALQDELRHSDVLLVLLSKPDADHVDQDWLARELKLARGLKVPIIPVRLREETSQDTPEGNSSEPESLRDVVGMNVSSPEEYGGVARRLVSAVRSGQLRPSQS